MLVRACIPPSNRSASQRANWHYPVICYSTQQTDRWGLRDPYRVIHAWYCHNCLNKGGSVRVCKHVALLLKAISFWFWFHPTTRNIYLLTTGINHQLQPPAVLQPNATGVPIPLTVNRQSRQKRSGNVNPVYATTATAVTTAPSATAAVATAAVATAAVATAAVTAAAATSAAVATPAATTAAVARPAVTTAAVTTAATPAVITAAATTAAATTAAAVIVVAPTTFTYMMNTISRPPVSTATSPVSTSPASTTPTFSRSSIGSIPSAGSTGSGGQGGAQPAGVHGGAVPAAGGQGSDAAGSQGGGAVGGLGGDAAGGQGADAAAAGGPGGGAARDRRDGAAGGQGGDAAAAGGLRDQGGGAAGRQAQSAAGGLVSSPVLSQYLLTIDTSFMTPIPPPSRNPVPRHNLFQIGHLQPRGLINTYNSCCHISLVLCCHRMCLKRYLSPARMTQRQDFSGLSFHEILSAMPSPRPFSLQLWIAVWNSLRPGQPIGQHEDIQMLSDLVLGSLDLTPDTSTTPATPVFTEFTCHYQCNSCTFSEPGTSTWEGKTFDAIPIVNPGHSASAVSVGQLLTDMLQSPIHTRCAVCRQLVVGGYRVTR